MQAANFLRRMEFFDRIATSGEFGAGTLAVAWVLLFRFYNSTTGRCDPGQSAIAKAANVTARHVKRATDDLSKAGWFIVKTGEGSMTRFGATTAYQPQFEGVTNSSGDDNTVSPDQSVTGDRFGHQGVTNPSGKQGKEQGKTKAPLLDLLADEFETFWRAFPKREGGNPKKPAKEKYLRAVRAGAKPADILAGAETYKKLIAQQRTAPRYIASALTWLNQARWQDLPEIIEEPRMAAGMC